METFLVTLSTNSENTLNCVEPRKGPCVKCFTKVHQFDLVLTDTENMTSHYVGLISMLCYLL